MCDAIARGKLRALIGLLLGVFVIASFEAAQVSAASGEPVSVAKKKKKKCKKGYKRIGKKCYKKRSGSFSGTASVSQFKIVNYVSSDEGWHLGDPEWAVRFEGSTSCGPTGEQQVGIYGPPRPGSEQPIFIAARVAEVGYPEPGSYTADPNNIYDSSDVTMGGYFDPPGSWQYPQYLASSFTGWFQVVHKVNGKSDCDSGQVSIQVSQN